MPGLASHTYVLFKALLEYESSSPLFEMIQKSHAQSCQLKHQYPIDG